MFAVMGITGQVGGAVALNLLASGHAVRAIVRDEQKAAQWKERGCELYVADVNDATTLSEAFRAAEGAFVMLPPIFDPAQGFPEARKAISALKEGLEFAKPQKVVALSTIGGHLTRPNLLNQLHLLEIGLESLSMPIAFLRPAWFMENTLWDIAPAKERGIVPSFLQPLDRKFPMIAARDIGQAAAELMHTLWKGHQVVQLEGPKRITPNDIARALTGLLGREVSMEAVPSDTWADIFRAQGMKNPVPRMQMLQGFNEGWIEFDGGMAASRKTKTMLSEALDDLIYRAS